MIKLLFPLRIPTKLETLILSEISESMWMWSRHTSASIMAICFQLYSSLAISFLSLICFPHKIPFRGTSGQRRYDICSSNLYVLNYLCHWYSRLMSSFWYFSAVGRPHLYCIKRSYFIWNAKAFGNSPAQPGVFKYKKPRDISVSCGFSVCYLSQMGELRIRICL